MRLETRFVQVPNDPQTINAINNLAAVWGWTVQSIQVTDSKISYEGDSTGWISDYGAYVQMQIITEHTNYASITYQRDMDDPKYEKLSFLEEKYNKCDDISFLTDDEETQKKKIEEEIDKKHSLFKTLFIVALVVTIWGLFSLTMVMHRIEPLAVGIAACVGLWVMKGRYVVENNSDHWQLMRIDKQRRQEMKQEIINQAKAV